MEKEKKNKIFKITGLVVLTIAVVLAVFLSVYFVNKNNPTKEDTINTYVGQINKTDFGTFTVTGRNLEKSINGNNAKDKNVYFVINIFIDASKKDFTIKKSDFNFSGYKASKHDGYLYKNLKIKKGEKKDIKIAFLVPEGNKELFLYCYGYRVKMGNSMEYIPIQ